MKFINYENNNIRIWELREKAINEFNIILKDKELFPTELDFIEEIKRLRLSYYIIFGIDIRDILKELTGFDIYEWI